MSPVEGNTYSANRNPYQYALSYTRARPILRSRCSPELAICRKEYRYKQKNLEKVAHNPKLHIGLS